MKIFEMGEKNGIKIYVQVSLSIMEEKTREREFGSLLLVQDNYSKYIIKLNDMHIGNNYKGVQCLNLKEFFEMEV
jgi:predicted AAA+ superfamily ATPase